MYDRFYTTHKPFGDNICVYCGAKAESMDHCPPLIDVYGLGTAWFFEKGIELLKVPSCNECNDSLGRKMLYTLKERKRHIELMLDIRYEELLTAPDWDEDDFDQCRGRLRDYVEDRHGLKLWIVRRLEWARNNTNF